MSRATALVTLAAVAGCGSAAPSDRSTASGNSPTATFNAYNRALLRRDFKTACGTLAPETSTTLIENIEARFGDVASCEEAFRVIYDKVEGTRPGTTLDEISRNAKVVRVRTSGDGATVTWSTRAAGKRLTWKNAMRRVDGEWKLVDVSSPADS